MARTESLMGSGKLFDANKPGRDGVAVKYQVQVNGPDEASAGSDQWQGYIRISVGSKLPGSKSAEPNPKVRYLLLLEDNDNRQGRVQINQKVGKVGDFYNFGIVGENL